MDDVKRLELIREAVLYCQRVQALGMPTSCYSKALREPVHFLWEIKNGPKTRVARFRSRAAVGLKHGKGELVWDHAIPFKFLQAELLELQSVTPKKLRQVLDKIVTVIITKEEDKRLNKHGYGHKMPEDWDKVDPFARYKKVGIVLVRNTSLSSEEKGQRRPPRRVAGQHLSPLPPSSSGETEDSMCVIAATRNPTEPWGRRPYHRPDCSEATKHRKVKTNWTSYSSAAAAKADGRRPCKRCYP